MKVCFCQFFIVSHFCIFIQDLLSSSHNTEKVIYFLLLERKRRRPAYEDDSDNVVRARGGGTAPQPECAPVVGCADPPRKRIDTCRVNGSTTAQFGQISEGSPLTPRRQHFGSRHHHHHGGSSRRSPSTGSHSSLQSPTRSNTALVHYNNSAPSSNLGTSFDAIIRLEFCFM